MGPRGRWNRERKREHFRKQDEDLDAKVPHDEQFQQGDGNYKQWTHLLEGGTKAGGQQQKLDYRYRGANTGTTHFYVGKYDNVKHQQRILRTGYKDPQTKERSDLTLDTRPQFDCRLLDDMIRRNYEEQ